MAATATIRELRFRFHKIKRLLEAEGEILVTEKGKPRYRLTSIRRCAQRCRQL
jgi:antitoxin (DNA-binding transcriptional repressor) of toxin-antitoxin stability system